MQHCPSHDWDTYSRMEEEAHQEEETMTFDEWVETPWESKTGKPADQLKECWSAAYRAGLERADEIVRNRFTQDEALEAIRAELEREDAV